MSWILSISKTSTPLPKANCAAAIALSKAACSFLAFVVAKAAAACCFASLANSLLRFIASFSAFFLAAKSDF